MNSTHTACAAGTPPTVSATQRAAGGVGLLLLIVGVFGFVGGVTESLDQLSGPGAGVFRVSDLYNLLYLALGVLGRLAVHSSMARTYLIAGGISSLGLSLYGRLLALTSEADYLADHSADGWLLLVLGAAMVLLGLIVAPSDAQTRPGGQMRGFRTRVLEAPNPPHRP